MDPETLAKLGLPPDTTREEFDALTGGEAKPTWLNTNTAWVNPQTGQTIPINRFAPQQQPGSVSEQDMLNYQKARFNQEHGLDRHQVALGEAQQNWQRAVNQRDFEAAEFWKNRSYELERANLSQRAFEYMGNLKRGPQDWVRYWYQSRGEMQPAGEQVVPVEQALPSWAKPLQYGAGAPRSVAPQWAANAPAATPAQSPVPTWAGGDLGSGTAGGRQIVGGSPAVGTPLSQFSDDQIRLASGLDPRAAEVFKQRSVATPGRL